MANAIYGKYKSAVQSGGSNTDLLAGDVKAALIDIDDDAFDAADEFLSDIAGAAIVATSANLAGKTVSDLGVFDCDDFAWPAVSGDEFEAVIFYIDTGVAGTSRLVCFLDTSQGGLPLTPTGEEVTFTVDAAGVWGL